MKDCNNCRCKPVCKETEAWQEYIKQHLEMRNKSSLFDKDPECPYYIGEEKEETHREESDLEWCFVTPVTSNERFDHLLDEALAHRHKRNPELYIKMHNGLIKLYKDVLYRNQL